MARGTTLKLDFPNHHKLFYSLRWYKKGRCETRCAGECLTMKTRVRTYKQLSLALLSSEAVVPRV